MPEKAPVKPENQEPEVKIIPSEPPKEPERIEIDAETGKPVERTPPVPASVSVEEFRKLQSRMEFHARQNENLQRKLEETLNRFSQYQRPVEPEKIEKNPENFDKHKHAIATENYQEYTKLEASEVAEKVAEKKFKAMMEEREKIEKANQERIRISNQIEREKAWVLEKTPELNDENSEAFRGYYATYSRLISEDPTLPTNPKGPRLVWYEWQNSLSGPNNKQESDRLKRVAAGAVPASRQSSGPKTYQLTQEEIELCKNSGISPARYAQVKEMNLKEGVSA